MNFQRKRLLIAASVVYAAVVAYLCLLLYPFSREFQHAARMEDIGALPVFLDYAGLGIVVVALGFIAPSLISMLLLDRRFGWGVLFVCASTVIQAAYFVYCGQYSDGGPPLFAVYFPHVDFFSEFRSLKMVLSSPLVAAAGLAAFTWCSAPHRRAIAADIAADQSA